MKATKKMITAVTTGLIADVTADNFNQYAQAMFVANSTIQDNVQVLVEFAVKHAESNDNSFNLITYLLTLATSKYGTGMRSATLKDYLEAVVVGAKWMKAGNGDLVFKKASKKTKIKYDMDLLATKWYDFNKDGIAVPKLDFIQMLEQTMVRWDKAHQKADNGEAELVNAEANDQLASEFAQWLESKKAAQADAVHAAH